MFTKRLVCHCYEIRTARRRFYSLVCGSISPNFCETVSRRDSILSLDLIVARFLKPVDLPELSQFLASPSSDKTGG